jgi:tetratricopeptide (TPR) repeat protein
MVAAEKSPLWLTRLVCPFSKSPQHAALAACWFFASVDSALSVEPARADMGLGRIAPGPPAEATAASQSLAHYASALCLESKVFIRESLPHYQRVIQADPGNTELAFYVAELLLNYADKAAAVKLLEDCIQKQGDKPGTWLNLARFLGTYLGNDPFEKERPGDIIAEALKRFPKSAEVIEAAVVHQLKNQQRDAAMKLLAQAQTQPVVDPGYWVALGRIAQEVWPLAHPELRDEHRAKVNPFFAKAKLLAKGPTHSETLATVAQYYVASNQLPLATEVAESLSKISRTAVNLRLLARLYEAGEKSDNAYPLLEEILKLEPGDIDTHRRLLAHYLESQEYREAVPHAEAMVKLAGSSTSDYWRLGQLHLLLRDPDEALAVTRRALALFPDSAQLHLMAADCHRARRRFTEGLAAYQKAETLAKATQPDVLSAAFYSNWADLLQSGRQFDEAAKKYQRAISMVPEDEPQRAAVILNNLGYMWLEQGRNLEQAGDFIARAVKLEPESPVYLDSLGWFHFLKGDYSKALELLLDVEKRLAKTEQQDAEIFDHIGQVYERLKESAKAKEYYEKALKLDPKNEGTQKHLDRMLGRLRF